MMIKPKKLYHSFEESAFFGLSSPHKLAELLNIEFDVLLNLCAHGDRNFNQFTLGKGEKTRWIETPKKDLKKIQSRIHVLLSRIQPPDFLFSAYKGRSSVKNAERHAKNYAQPMVKLDIRKFYPSAHGKRIHSLFKYDFRCAPDIAGMLTTLCTIGPTTNATWRHLPTGGVTSPILAYLAYRQMFGQLEKLAITNELTMSVMADDITFSGPKATGEVLCQAQHIVTQYGLKPNLRKNKNWSANFSNKVVTGVLLTPKGMKVRWPQKKKIASIKATLVVTTDPKERTKLFQQLVGSLSSAGQIEPRFQIGARCALEEWKRDTPAWAWHQACSRKRQKKKMRN